MSKLLNLITREPVMAATGGLVAATIGALVAFGVHITDVQREAIEGWCLAVLALGVAVRSQVTPAAKLPKRTGVVTWLNVGDRPIISSSKPPEPGPTNVTPLPTPPKPEDAA